jgi:hypothetical protein
MPITSEASPDFMPTLLQAVATFQGKSSDNPSTVAVVDALLQAEKTAKQQRILYPFESLLGKWRLCFTTGTRKAKQRGGIVLGKGFYVPKVAKAHISFSLPSQALDATANRGEITNQIQFGPVLLKLDGPAKYLGKKNLLAFDFTHMRVSLFGRNVYSGQVRGGKAQSADFHNQPIAKLPFFAFFLVTENFIAARGRGGGLALWIRES